MGEGIRAHLGRLQAARLLTILGVALAVILLTQEQIIGIGPLTRLELSTLDRRFQFRGSRTLPQDSLHVVIVEISDDSFRSLPEKFPWPRSYYAHLVRNLKAAGARAVGIDLIFSDADAVAANDQAFRQAIDSVGIVVLAGKREQDNADYVRTSARENFGNIFYSTDSALGLVNIRADLDGIYRFYNMGFAVDAAGDTAVMIPTFGFAVLNTYFGLPHGTVPARTGDGAFRYAGRTIPAYDRGSMLINFYGPNGTFPHIKFHDVIDDEQFSTVDEQESGEAINTFSDPEFGYLSDGTFRDKIVLVGVTVPEYKDIFPVSIGRGLQRGDNMMYGVELHANAIESVLHNDFLHVEPPVVEILLVVLLTALTFAVTSAFRGTGVRRHFLAEVASVAFVALELLLIAAAALILFVQADTVVMVVSPILAVVGGYAASTVYNLVAERRQRLMIKAMFSTYVNPSVVDQLIADPRRLVLGGERKELTVLFSDIEGFTTISQHMPPEELVGLLNEYLNSMTALVFKYDGTLDKYEGDAVMAFWGAPVPMQDHALRACLSALEMQDAIRELNAAWEQLQRPHLSVRIGIHTGEMVVGNMGATGKFAYTVIGDAVNLASRLEGANKEFKTHLMVSERTYGLVRHAVVGRELESIIVKGRTEAVTTYELFQRRDRPLDPRLEEFLGLYTEAMQLYRAGEWKAARVRFEEALALRPGDTPTLLHIARVQAFEAAPPGAAAGGAVTLQRK